MQTIHIDSLDELPHAAAAVINALEGRSVVVFRGEMGAGKTTLIREIVARLGADDTVTSPTFAIVNQYTTREGKNIYHFDFYRINRLEEAYDFGYEEYFYSGDLCLVCLFDCFHLSPSLLSLFIRHVFVFFVCAAFCWLCFTLCLLYFFVFLTHNLPLLFSFQMDHAYLRFIIDPEL